MDYDEDMDMDFNLGANLYDDASPDILGCPNAQADFWDLQEFADNCEPTAESFIIRQFGFDDISPTDFAYISQANGWYTPGGGTSPDFIGEMMDLFGIDNHTNANASIQDLASEIAQGHGVIVGIRAEQLWDQGPLQDLLNWVEAQFGLDNPNDSPANHAICVTGFDLSDPDNPQVIVNDPGHPDGQGAAYPLDRFMDAWENSSFMLTATDNPLPAFTAMNIQGYVNQWLADNGFDSYDSTSTGVAEMYSSQETALGVAADSGFDWNGLSDSVHDIATPLKQICQDVAGVIAGVAGVVISANLLSNALSSDDFAYDL